MQRHVRECEKIIFEYFKPQKSEINTTWFQTKQKKKNFKRYTIKKSLEKILKKSKKKLANFLKT